MSLITHYKLNDNAPNTTVEDSQGFSNGTCSVNTNTIDATGKINGALDYGGSQYVDSNDTFTSVFNGSLSISLWAKLDDGQPVDDMYLFSSGEVLSSDVVRGFIAPNGDVSFSYGSDGNSTRANTNNPVFSNGPTAWTFITLVADSIIGGVGGLKIYINASNIPLHDTLDGDTSGIIFGDYSSALNLLLAAKNVGGVAESFADGLLDDFRIYNHALTPNEISLIYNSGNGTEKENPTRGFSQAIIIF